MLSIEQATVPTPEVRELVAALDAELIPLYHPDQHHGLELGDLFQPGVRFFVARLDGTAVGCGGFALFEDCAEIKRMYVAEAARGRGVGKALLAHIENEARAAGARLLRLETGIHQHAALALYQRAGFAPCPAFGPYRDMPAHNIAASLFLKKAL